MTHFEFLTIAMSFVLGLAVTVVLRSLITAFRARRTTRMHWVPFAWAVYVLVIQFDIWWELYGLVSMEIWSVWAFVLLLLLALLVFGAGALVLPMGALNYPDDLGEYFRQDGRWGVAVIGAFCITGVTANVTLFGVSLFGLMNLWNYLAIGLIAVMLVSRRQAIQSVVTMLFGIWLTMYLWMFVPATY